MESRYLTIELRLIRPRSSFEAKETKIGPMWFECDDSRDEWLKKVRVEMAKLNSELRRIHPFPYEVKEIRFVLDQEGQLLSYSYSLESFIEELADQWAEIEEAVQVMYPSAA